MTIALVERSLEMAKPLKERVALVTGSTSGIGLGIARALAGAGSAIVLNGFGAADEIEAERTRLARDFGVRVAYSAADMSKPEAIKDMIADTLSSFGHLDALIHCAAIHSSANWETLAADEMLRVLNVNVVGSFLIAKAAAGAMRTRSAGAIVLTSSSNVILGGTGGAAGLGGPAYVASKSAIIGLVRSLANSLGPLGITVNGILPGVTETPMIANYTPEHRAAQKTRIPLRRIADPSDIADVCLFLASPGARYMTGECVIVNGGALFG